MLALSSVFLALGLSEPCASFGPDWVLERHTDNPLQGDVCRHSGGSWGAPVGCLPLFRTNGQARQPWSVNEGTIEPCRVAVSTDNPAMLPTGSPTEVILLGAQQKPSGDAGNSAPTENLLLWVLVIVTLHVLLALVFGYWRWTRKKQASTTNKESNDAPGRLGDLRFDISEYTENPLDCENPVVWKKRIVSLTHARSTESASVKVLPETKRPENKRGESVDDQRPIKMLVSFWEGRDSCDEDGSFVPKAPARPPPRAGHRKNKSGSSSLPPIGLNVHECAAVPATRRRRRSSWIDEDENDEDTRRRRRSSWVDDDDEVENEEATRRRRRSSWIDEAENESTDSIYSSSSSLRPFNHLKAQEGCAGDLQSPLRKPVSRQAFTEGEAAIFHSMEKMFRFDQLAAGGYRQPTSPSRILTPDVTSVDLHY